MPNFLDIDQINASDLISIIELAKNIKARLKRGDIHHPLSGKQLAMIFEKPSTRTRTSFEVGINQLGGNSIVLNSENSQLSRGEPISDTAKVLSRYVDIIMIRCFSHQTLLDYAKYSDIPVINGLTDYSHPCQIMGDIMTFEEHKGSIKGKNIACVGDFNNIARSWIHAAEKLDFNLRISTPAELKPGDEIFKNYLNVSWHEDPTKAVQNVDLVTTDTWVSMGDKNNDKIKLLKKYQVNSSLMSFADKGAIFMHCLPAHREKEVTSDILDGNQSVVFDEAENRLHIQKAIMIWCLKNHSKKV
jgi:ornithine carbamoyltransferase